MCMYCYLYATESITYLIVIVVVVISSRVTLHSNYSSNMYSSEGIMKQ